MSLTLVKTYDTSAIASDPTGIAILGSSVFLMNGNGNLYQLNRAMTTLIRAVADVGNSLNGMELDGKFLWTVETAPMSAAADVIQLDLNGNKVQIISVLGTDTTPRGITTDGKNLWWVGQTGDNLYQMTKTGVLIQTIDVSGMDTAPKGITFDGKYFWMTGGQNDKIYQLDINGTLVEPNGTDVSGIDNEPRGITTDGKFIYWVGTQNDSVYQMAK